LNQLQASLLPTIPKPLDDFIYEKIYKLPTSKASMLHSENSYRHRHLQIKKQEMEEKKGWSSNWIQRHASFSHTI